ncbi:MAG: hypothetical protein IKI03_10045 [Clostridia bacterium]|nr:hypothetical protein [Clostridia bacterium]
MTKKRISIPVFIAVILFACLITFQITAVAMMSMYRNSGAAFSPSSDTGKDAENGGKDGGDFIARVTDRLSELDSEFRSLYIGDIDEDALIDGVMLGYIYGTGDDFGEYYNENDYKTFMEDLSGEGEGIGINVIYNTDYDCIEVLNIFPDSPAAESGLMVGDLIVTVGEEKEAVSDMGYYVAISRLRGKSGTEAVFSVSRGDKGETIDFRIIRGPYVEVNVYSHVYGPDHSIGVVRINGFDGSTPEQFKDAVEKLLSSGCGKLILDVRNNPGGELGSIIDTLDYLLPEGPIIRIYDADDNLVDQYDSDASCLDVPMAVLVNHSTASAAELFTAALRDYDMAKVVGTTTYGKGCMQTTRPLEGGGAYSVTYRMFKPPFSESYHKIGIVPDVEIELDPAVADKSPYKITDEEDNQLRAAAATFGSD